MPLKLVDRNSIGDFVQAVIDESVKASLQKQALREKEKQVAVAPKGGTEKSGDNQGSGTNIFSQGDSGDTPAPSKTMDDETEKMKSGDVKPRDIVDKLNSIRSGRSFKDSAVSQAMDDYISSLSKAERVALFAFLKGIGQIVTGEVPGQQAQDPSDAPSDVQMAKGEEKQHKEVKPNVIKASRPKTKGGPSAEDTTAPTPITAKRK